MSEHTPNRAPQLRAGAADELVVRVYWQESTESDWAETTLSAHDVRDAQYLGVIEIEDARHSVFRLADGRTVAQVTDMKRNASKQRFAAGGYEFFKTSRSSWTVERQMRIVGYIDVVSTASGVDYAAARSGPTLPVDALEAFRDHMLHHQNPSPPPLRRRRRTTDTSLRRVRDIVQREERPFDPERRYPRDTKPHHFAINASNRAWITYDLISPESAEEGDVEERGYYAPGGWTFPDPGYTGERAREFGADNALSVDEVLRWAQDRGPWHGERGTYYDEGDPDTDYSTGEETRYAVHFEVSPGTLKRIERLLGVRR